MSTRRVDVGTFRALLAPARSRSKKRKEQPALDPSRSCSDDWTIRLVGVTPPPINEWKTWHWRKYEREKRRWEEMVAVYCGGMRRHVAPSVVAVEVFYRFDDCLRHDPDGYTPKFILDGLVKAGVLWDDSDRVIRPLTTLCTARCDWRETIVRLSPFR